MLGISYLTILTKLIFLTKGFCAQDVEHYHLISYHIISANIFTIGSSFIAAANNGKYKD